VQPQLLLTQHLFAVAAVLFWQRRKFHQSGGSNWSTAPDLRMTFRCKMHELTSVDAPVNASCFLGVWECERMQSSVRPVDAAFLMPLAGMEIRGSVPHHSGGLIIPV
jgi:hypothetical protein